MTAGTAVATLPAVAMTRPRTILIVLVVSAGAVYFWHIGRPSLNPDEAYSAFAATRPTFAGVVDTVTHLDPGKSPLYYLVLHFFAAAFGPSETALRAFSALFAVAQLPLLYLVAAEVFDAEVAVVAVVLWAFNPVAVILARFARMYAALIALSLFHVLMLFRLRRGPTALRIFAFAISGAAMLYLNYSGLLLLAADIAILSRDLNVKRPSRAGWIGLALALLIFLPFAAVAFDQIHALISGHGLDWIAPANSTPSGYKIAVSLIAAAIASMLVFGPRLINAGEIRGDEPLRCCAIWLLIPALALAAGGAILRPIFVYRYLAPAWPALAVLVARGTGVFGRGARNLIALAVASLFVFSIPVYTNTAEEPWRRMGQVVAANGPDSQPVFFEPGFLSRSKSAVGANLIPGGFPDGFFRVPFDYYCRADNPRLTIDPSDPPGARQAIARVALANRGAWLISVKNDADARLELPSSSAFEIALVESSFEARLYHVVPLLR